MFYEWITNVLLFFIARNSASAQHNTSSGQNNYFPDSSTTSHLHLFEKKKLFLKNSSYGRIALEKLIEIHIKLGNFTFHFLKKKKTLFFIHPKAECQHDIEGILSNA